MNVAAVTRARTMLQATFLSHGGMWTADELGTMVSRIKLSRHVCHYLLD